MNEQDAIKQKLLNTIKARRASINSYANSLERNGVRLTNLSIIFTAVTAVLTAGPALGGTRFTQGTSALLRLSSDSIVWQILCLVALILSIVTAIINNMNKATDTARRLTKAQSTGVLLEKLELALEYDQVTVEMATKQFQEYLAEAPFIPEKSMPAH